MGSGQQCGAETGPAGAGELSTGAKGKERKDRRGRRLEERKEGRGVGSQRRKKGHRGRPVGDPSPQRGKVPQARLLKTQRTCKNMNTQKQNLSLFLLLSFRKLGL